MELTNQTPMDSVLDRSSGLPKDMLSLLSSISKTDWTSDMPKLILHLMNVCEMLPGSELLRNLKLQLKTLHRNWVVSFERRSKIPNDVMLDHLTGILHDIMSLVRGNDVVTLHNSISDHLVAIIITMLKLSQNICKRDPIIGFFKETLSQVLNESLVDPVHCTPENLQSLMETNLDCIPINQTMIHLIEIREYLHSLLELRSGPLVWIQRNLLLLILKVSSRLPVTDSQEGLKSHLEYMTDLVSGTNMMKNLDPVCVLPEDLRSLLVFMDILVKHVILHFVSEIRVAHIQDTVPGTPKDLCSEISRKMLSSVKVQSLVSHFMNVCEALTESEPIRDLQSQLVNICRILLFEHKWTIPKNVLLDHLVAILQDIISQVTDISGIPHNQKINLLVGLIVAMLKLSVNISKMDPINGLLHSKVSQIMNQLSLMKPVSEILVPMESFPKILPINLVVYHLDEIKWFLQSLTKYRMGRAVWVPRNPLLLCLNILKMVPDGYVTSDLKSHIVMILDPVSRTPDIRDHAILVPGDLTPLLAYLEILTLMSQKIIMDFTKEKSKDLRKRKKKRKKKKLKNSKIEESDNESFSKNLLEMVNFSLIYSKLKNLMSRLMDQCKLWPDSDSTKDLESKLMALSKMLPDDYMTDPVRSKDEILDHLVEILEHMVSQVMDMKNTIRMNTVAVDDLECIIKKLLSMSMDVSEPAPRSGKLMNMISALGNVPRNQSTYEKIEVFVLRLLNVCEMLPESELLKDLRSQLINLYWTDPLCEVPSDDIILAQFVSILQGLMLQVTKVNSECWIPKNQMVECLAGIFKDLLSRSMKITEMIPEHRKLQDMLLIHTNMYGNEWTQEKHNILMSRMMGVCKMLPQSNLIKDIHMQLINISRMDPSSRVSKDVILDHIVAILMDVTPWVMAMNNTSTCVIPKDQIMDNLFGIIKALLSFSMNICSETGPINELLKDMLSQILNISLNMHENETFKNLWLHLTELSKLEPENEYLHDLQSRIKSIYHMDPSKVPEELIMHATLGTIQDLEPKLLNKSELARKKGISVEQLTDYICEMENNVKAVLMNVSYLRQIPSKMQLQGIIKSSNEIPEKINLLAEMDLDSLADNLTPDCMNEMDHCIRQLQPIKNPTKTDRDELLKLLSLMMNMYMLQPVKDSLHSKLGSLLMDPVCDKTKEVTTDPNSGVPIDLLSLLVYTYFPASDMQTELSGWNNDVWYQYIPKTTEGANIQTGSRYEHLGLPFVVETNLATLPVLVGQDLGKSGLPVCRKDPGDDFLIPDLDTMKNLGWFKDIYNTMTLEIDTTLPVFCRIKTSKRPLAVNVPKGLPYMFDGQYLNSAKINHIFQSMEREVTYCPSLAHKFKTSYESTALQTLSFINNISKHYSEVPSEDKFKVQHGNCVISSDAVFCIPIKWNEEYKHNFLRRLKPHQWPMNSIQDLTNLLSEQVYAVPKPDPNDSKTGNLRWRLSFSVIEIELARSLTDTQRRCYKLLKALIKYNVNVDSPERRQFPSYYLKTAMFWFCETTTEESWRIENLGNQWLKLLDSLIASLEKETLPMYFIPTHNLLEHKTSLTQDWMIQLKEIRKYPLESFGKFWSKYTTISFSDPSSWGSEYGKVLKNLHANYSLICLIKENKIGDIEHQKLQHCNTKLEMDQKYLRWIVARHHLSVYCLSDFLTFVNYFPQTNEFISFAKAQSKEHLIWLFYKQFISSFSEYLDDSVDTCLISMHLAYLAEVTHHIVLKYGDKVKSNINKELFSANTAEKLYLMACCIQNKNDIIINEKCILIRYANYLQAERQYENAVQLLNTCQNMHSCQCCRISRLTSEVLDVCLKLTLAFEHETSCNNSNIVYHLLTSSYIQAGVLAEVLIPEHFNVSLPVVLPNKPSVETKSVLLGFQFIISGKLLEAFQTFDKCKDGNVIKYSAMLFIIAKLNSKPNVKYDT